MTANRNESFLGTTISTNATGIIENITDSLQRTTSESGEKVLIPAEIWTGRVAIYGVGGTVIAIFGLVGNLISIIVLSRYRQKSSAPLLLILLALFDMLVLGSELVLETLSTLSQAKLISPSYNVWLTPGYVIFFAVPFIAQTGTTFMTVTITIERYIAVVKPFLASQVCKKSNAFKASAVILVWSIVYHTPRYLAYTFYKTWNDDTNATKIVFNRTEFGSGYFYNTVFITWINFTIEFLLPCFIVVVLNILMLRALRRSQKLDVTKSRNSCRKGGQRLTHMVIAVATMFFFCELFSAVSLIMVRGLNFYYECSVHCNNFMALADTMIIFNSACNFILYCAVGKKFREIFVHIFCRWPFRKKSNVSSSNNTHTRVTSLSVTKTQF